MEHDLNSSPSLATHLTYGLYPIGLYFETKEAC